MDVWVNFTHATKFQAEGIFKCFFPYKATSAASAASLSSSTSTASDPSQQNLCLPKRKYNAIPLLEEVEITELAKRFADAIPEDELSVGCVFLFFPFFFPFVYVFVLGILLFTRRA